jgi:hypothetical protein
MEFNNLYRSCLAFLILKIGYKPIKRIYEKRRRQENKVGRTPACVKTCNSQDTMSATWRKERSTVKTNEIMKTATHRSESWCWRQLLSLLSRVSMLVLTQLVCGLPKINMNFWDIRLWEWMWLDLVQGRIRWWVGVDLVLLPQQKMHTGL